MGPQSELLRLFAQRIGESFVVKERNTGISPPALRLLFYQRAMINKEGAMKRLKIQLGILIVSLAGLSAGYGILRAAAAYSGAGLKRQELT
jgi:hypothetical protein